MHQADELIEVRTCKKKLNAYYLGRYSMLFQDFLEIKSVKCVGNGEKLLCSSGFHISNWNRRNKYLNKPRFNNCLLYVNFKYLLCSNSWSLTGHPRDLLESTARDFGLNRGNYNQLPQKICFVNFILCADNLAKNLNFLILLWCCRTSIQSTACRLNRSQHKATISLSTPVVDSGR